MWHRVEAGSLRRPCGQRDFYVFAVPQLTCRHPQTAFDEAAWIQCPFLEQKLKTDSDGASIKQAAKKTLRAGAEGHLS